jgi:hypothetical protein
MLNFVCIFHFPVACDMCSNVQKTTNCLAWYNYAQEVAALPAHLLILILRDLGIWNENCISPNF